MSIAKHTSVDKCDICGFTSDDDDEDVLYFGDWMKRSGITAHYFCLLLSTNLPQNGGDKSGILGFLLRDIRLEIRDAKSRKCCYCDEISASIACHTCKKYFHLVCGHRYDCLFQFGGYFHSYCDKCVPLDENQLLKKQIPPVDERCYICAQAMGKYIPIAWIYGRCCGNGYVHRLCMRKYALAAGYYLICIWCRSKDFRDDIRLRGIFVPDRDAKWELDRNAYAELHRGHKRCNMEVCNCPKGRDFERGNWTIIVCTLCGSFGTHYPGCISSPERKKKRADSFKCDTCLSVTESVGNTTASSIHRESETRQQENDTLVKQLINLSDAAQTEVREDHLERNTSYTEPQEMSDLDTQESNTNSNEMSLDSSAVVEKILIITDYPEFDDRMNVLSTCKVRINLNSPRFRGKTIDHILEEKGLITDADQFDKINGPGVFQEFEEMIEEFKTKRNKAAVIENIDEITSELSAGEENIFIITDYPEFDSQMNVLSTCKVRINLDSPRFQGKTIDDILEEKDLITDTDKFEKTNGPGVFNKVEAMMEEIRKKRQKTVDLSQKNVAVI